jgi:hypothetical protein
VLGASGRIATRFRRLTSERQRRSILLATPLGGGVSYLVANIGGGLISCAVFKAIGLDISMPMV